VDMLHLEKGGTDRRNVRRQAQTEGYDGVFHREFVLWKGHDAPADRACDRQYLDFVRL